MDCAFGGDHSQESEEIALKKMLFVARRYPPSVGGIETFCYNLYSGISQKREVDLIALRKSSIVHLLWFMPLTFVRVFVMLLQKKYDVVYLSDGVTASMAIIFRPLFKNVTFISTIYGLEMTIKNPFARTLINAGVNSCHHVTTISENTLDIMKKYISPSKVSIVYVGIEPPQIEESVIVTLRAEFESQYSLDFSKENVLLNFGRMVPRKGVARFLKEGFTLLDPSVRLILGGSGPDYSAIEATIAELNLNNRVILLNRPSDEIVAMLRASADLFIMPNVHYPNDVEGYGMAQLESMYSGMPVVAFAVDALVESVRSGGYLIEPDNYQAYSATINDYFKLSEEAQQEKRTEAQEYVQKEYSWEKTCSDYIALIDRDYK